MRCSTSTRSSCMAKSSTRLKAVILAGGSGERFWPLSTPERPKQFLDIFGGKSLLRQSVERLQGLVAPEDVIVVTASQLVSATQRELPEVPPGNIIGEPCRRDTAAAVAMGVAAAGDGMVGVFPADQLVSRPGRFRQAVRQAAKLASASERIAVLGIEPLAPSTQFGYINPKTGKFVEKPDAKRARDYIRKGYLWNAGIFVAGYGTFRRAIESLAPGLEPLFAPGCDFAAVYPELPKISFDYAVMEKYPHIGVVAADCGWDDVGGYLALERHFPELADPDGNLVLAKAQPVKLLGVRNLVVVSAPDGVLVVDKSHLGDIKTLFR